MAEKIRNKNDYKLTQYLLKYFGPNFDLNEIYFTEDNDLTYHAAFSIHDVSFYEIKEEDNTINAKYEFYCFRFLKNESKDIVNDIKSYEDFKKIMDWLYFK